MIEPGRIGTAVASRQRRRAADTLAAAQADASAAVGAALLDAMAAINADVGAAVAVAATELRREDRRRLGRRRERRGRDADWAAIAAFAATPAALVQFSELAAAVRAVCRWLVAEEARDGTE